MLVREIKEMAAACRRGELRKFGVVVGAFLLLLAGFLLWAGRGFALYFIYAGGALLVSGWVAPAVLKPVYLAWMSLAVVMGFIMTRVILTLLYGLLFTPVGLALRILGRDPLEERFLRAAKTYWRPRKHRRPDPRAAERQF